MGLALIRLEDIGPGGHYETEESQMKLRIVAEYLRAEAIPFHAAVISRFVDPVRGIDRSVANPYDGEAARFLQTVRALVTCGASLGMHGYTHQYGSSVSGEGYEFSYAGCTADCPPDDSPDSLAGADRLERSYAFRRFAMAAAAFRTAGLHPDWFETPHYAASTVQRRILEACFPLFYEENPDAPGHRRVSIRISNSAWGAAWYVPAPLSYVGGQSVERDVKRICSDAEQYAEEDLASFFYHPFLEFRHIRLRDGLPPLYEDETPLKTIIRRFQVLNRRFVSIRSLFPR
jgi:hypothetical protein